MQSLQSVKVHSASDSAHEGESPLATDKTPFQPKSTAQDSDAHISKKWSSKIEVPIGTHLHSWIHSLNAVVTDMVPATIQAWQYTFSYLQSLPFLAGES